MDQSILVVGPGAMGCLFAGLLAEDGNRVWLLDRSAERASRISTSGIRVEGIGGSRVIPADAVCDPQLVGPVDLAFLWVKAFDTATATESALPALDRSTRVVTLQNGLGNLEAIARFVDRAHLIGGTTSCGATLLDVGAVRHTGRGETILGRPDGAADSRVERAAAVLTSAGIPTEVSDAVGSAIWSKLILNAAINPLTAITGLENGRLLDDQQTRRLLDLVAAESQRIASAAGIALAYPDPAGHIRSVCRATATNRSSMLQDVLRGKRTEIDAINGALVRKARALGLEAPVNETLLRLVRSIEAAARRPE
jgi:2-dehydropantoate 2-reductase